MYGDIEKINDNEALIDGVDIDLTPDMSRVWGKVIKGLRESGETMLHAACLDLNTVDYTRDTIEIICKDDTIFNLLEKHKVKIEEFVGKGCVNIYKQKESIQTNKDTITRLEKLFGDKLIIQRR